MIPQIFTDKDEARLTIPCTYGAKNINNDPGSRYAYRVIYSVKLTDIKAGDLIHVVAQGEVTNDVGRDRGVKAMYNVMVADYLALGTSDTDVSGLKIRAAMGMNTNPERHHEVVNSNCYYVFEQDFSEVYVNNIYYCASTAAVKGDTLDIEKYGMMQIALWRKD